MQDKRVHKQSYIYNGYIMFKSSLILNMMKCYGH